MERLYFSSYGHVFRIPNFAVLPFFVSLQRKLKEQIANLSTDSKLIKSYFEANYVKLFLENRIKRN